MAGGFFSYNQSQIRHIWEEIEQQLQRQGKEKSEYELTLPRDFYEDYPEHKIHVKYPERVQEIMKEAIAYLKIAEVYTQRIDYYLSGDDEEQVLYERLIEDLYKLQKTN